MNKLTPSSEGRAIFDPFADLENWFGRVLPAGRRLQSDRGGAITPALDVSETQDAFLVKAEIPGVKNEDISVSFQDGVLTINAESKYEHNDEKDGRLVHQERSFGKYVRSLRLGAHLDESRIKATYRDGILELVLPKAEEVKPKKIEVVSG